jgi:hypothetical protein
VGGGRKKEKMIAAIILFATTIPCPLLFVLVPVSVAAGLAIAVAVLAFFVLAFWARD